jgi:hypothetical protein
MLSIQTTHTPKAPGCESNCWYKYCLQLFQSESIVQEIEMAGDRR